MPNLSEILTPGAPPLPEGLRTLVVSPEHELEPGMTVRAAFTFRNQGGAPATGVRVRFSVPEGLMYLVGTGRLDGVAIDDERGNSPLITREGAHIGDVAPGEERRIEASFCVAGSIENGTTVELQAAVASFEVPPVGSNVVRLIARSRPQLAGELTGITLEARGDRVTPGSEAQITVRVNNAGESSAHDVVIAAPVPEHTSYVVGSARVNGREIERDLGRSFDSLRAPVIAANLPVGANAVLTYRVRVDAPLPDETAIVATARVASQETPAFSLGSGTLTVQSAPEFNGSETVLAVEPGASVRPGERVALAFTAHNAGSATAEEVRVALRLPATLIPVRGASRVDGHPVREQRKEPFSFDLGKIAAGARVELHCEAVVASPLADGSTLPVAGTLSWKPASGAGERAFDHVLTVRSGPAFLPRGSYVSLTGNSVVQPGDEVEAEIGFGNSGSGAASDAVLQFKFDAAFDDVRITEGGKNVALDGESTELGTIDPYTQRRFVFHGHVRSPYPDRSDVRCGAVLHAREIAEVPLGEAVWRVDSHPEFSTDSSKMTLDGETVLRPNCTADVDVTLSNLGTEVARDVRVRLYVSPEARLESVDGAMREKSSLLFGDIAPAASAAARLSVRLLRSAGDRLPVAIDAVLTAESMLPLPLGRLEITTAAAPDFSLGSFRSETPAEIPAGDTAEWLLHLRNGGDGTARSVRVEIEQPASLIYVPNSTRVNGVPVRDVGAHAPFAAEGGLLLSDVEPGVEAVVRWADVVHNGLGAGTAVARIARVSYDEGRTDEIVAGVLTVRGAPGFANAIPGLPFGLDGAIGPAPAGPHALGESRFVELPRATPIDSQDAQAASVFGAVHFAALDASDGSAALDAVPENGSAGNAGTLVAFSRARLEQTRRFLEEANFGRPVTHLFALRAFFPDAVGAADVSSPSLTAMREVLRESLDRLFIKMRLPEYRIVPRDLESAPARSVLERFLLDAGSARGTPPDAAGVVLTLRGSYDAADLAGLFASMQRARAATSAPWAALARLLPDSTAPARLYRTQLVQWLDGLLDASPDDFAEILDRRDRGGEIDDAYAAFREESFAAGTMQSA
ncbi:MAG: hypothetical protein ACLQPV_00295 [Vulcanimicrobiaceae bacterium]